MINQYCALVPLGPGKKELLRLKDLLESLSCFASANCAFVIVIDDGDHGSNIATLGDFPFKVVTIKNPRNGRGWGWEGGTSTAVLAGFRYVLENEVKYVLKMDTDTLVISPFHERITRVFEQNESVGMIGAHLKPGENFTGYWPSVCGEKLLKALRPVSIWRYPRLHLRSGFSSGNRKVKRYLQLALKNGYTVGEICAGGGYAVCFESLRRFKNAGVFDDPLAFLYAGGDDPIFTMLVKTCGLELLDLSGPGEVFSIAKGGLRDIPENLAAGGYSIIHPLKTDDEEREEQIRRFFRDHRLSVQRS